MDATRPDQAARVSIGRRALESLPDNKTPGSRSALLGRRIRALAAMATAMHCAQVAQNTLRAEDHHPEEVPA